MFEQRNVKETLDTLQTDLVIGLSSTEAEKRLAQDGPNEMKEAEDKSFLSCFLEQLNDPLIFVLLIAAAVSIMLRELSDAVIVGVVVIVNALVGVLQEGKARKALEALKKMSTPHAFVIRDGMKQEILAAELVKGDVVCLEAGGMVPADLRLVESSFLKIEESALTGESLPVDKDADFLIETEEQVALGDRHNMAYMSTIVTNGRGKGIVTDVGMDTEIGRIATMITEEKEEMTPLQLRLGELGKMLSILSIGLCIALFMVAILQQRNPLNMLMTAISLAVAAVPEGLPTVVTICLALSVTRMVKVNTIIRRLPSVETLGSVSVVCSDKTGTLTQNCMTVEWCYWNEEFHESGRKQGEEEFLNAMILCNDAIVTEEERMGDPTELALLDYGLKMGFHKELLEQNFPRCGEIPFDSQRKMMTTYHRQTPNLVNQGGVSYTKGAPDEVIKRCTKIKRDGRMIQLTNAHREEIAEVVRVMSSRALRTLGIAMCSDVGEATEEDLVFLGLVGMKDPPRPEAREAVETFRGAGVDTVMITGDHVDTAFAIGKQLGIVTEMHQCMTGADLMQLSEDTFMDKLRNVRVFARVSPAQKVQIIKGFQKTGQIVAMTGDGVNDAPSLKAADIGIAMGKLGTDVAKQASDMILTDDNFATIEKAIEEGRGVYENIRKSVIFLLSSNLGEIMTMFVAVLCGFASPLKSAHILWINLITDSLPALALGVDHNDGKMLMKVPPRMKQESLFASGGFLATLFYGVLIAVISLTAFLMLPYIMLKSTGSVITIENLAKALQEEGVLVKSQTYAFTVLGMSQLYHAIGMRDVRKSVLSNQLMENPLMIVACLGGFLLQFAVTEVPILIKSFGTSSLSLREWITLSILASFPLLAHEMFVILGVGKETKKANHIP